MTNQPNIAAAAHSPWDLASAWPATITTFAATFALLPLAYSQFGHMGTIALAIFAAAIIVSTWSSALLAAAVAVNYPKLSALASSSGIRMVAPLVVAIVIATTGGRLAPVETLYYLVPLFMCSLAADVASHIRKLRQATALVIPSDSVAATTGGAI